MRTLYISRGPRFFRDIDLRNFELRTRWYLKYQGGVDFCDLREEGADLDEKRAEKVRLAQHMRNKVVSEMRMRKFRDRPKEEATDNVIPLSMFHRLQAG